MTNIDILSQEKEEDEETRIKSQKIAHDLGYFKSIDEYFWLLKDTVPRRGGEVQSFVPALSRLHQNIRFRCLA